MKKWDAQFCFFYTPQDHLCRENIINSGPDLPALTVYQEDNSQVFLLVNPMDIYNNSKLPDIAHCCNNDTILKM